MSSVPNLPPRGAPSGRAVGFGLAVLGAIAFSGKAILAKLMYGHGVDAVMVLMLRMLFALPIFILIAWWASRGQAALSARQWAGVLFLGFIGYYLSSLLDFVGLQYITASLERLILYLSPTLVVVMSWVLYRKPILPRQWLAMATSYAGVLLVFGREVGQQGADVVLGAALIMGSAASYACYLLASARLVHVLGSLRLVGLASTVACVLCILHFLLLRPVEAAFAVAPAVIWLSLINATVCTVFPILFLMMAIERIGPGASAQAGMIGPLSTILLGAVLLGEPFTVWVGLGTILVLVGVWMFSQARA
jgi:drug/metabolite transporter (DMT)-like permease